MQSRRFYLSIMTTSLCSFLWAISSLYAHAGNIYMFKGQDGETLLTNRKVNDKNYKQVKVTYYADTNVHRYTNWGSSESAVLPSYSKNKNAFDDIIAQAARTFNVSHGLIKAVMHTESGFNINARSPVGAQGLMQLMPATARRFNVSNAYDPHQNIHAGAKYLSWLLKRFKGDLSLALAAYNAGEGNVDKYGGIPPFRETQDYVRRVLSRYNNLYAGSSATSSPTLPATTVNQPEKPMTASVNKPSPSRQIVSLGDGRYTDAPAGHTYATENAYVKANIYLSEQ